MDLGVGEGEKKRCEIIIIVFQQINSRFSTEN